MVRRARMADFANLTARLNLNISGFTSNLRASAYQINKYAANMEGRINDSMVVPAKKAGVEFKDVARIVQGIMISKVFYTSLNAIRRAARAVHAFSMELEYAHMVYVNLFGDLALAEEFINVLKDFSAKTPFAFRQSEAAAKRLLAYGIQYQNVMYVMRGVLAAASISSNPNAVEAISRALGQIQTKGRLMNIEMRQLAEAGVPAYEILAEKLGLTQKELQNLGKVAIPASVAINALVDGMTERFGGVVDASSRTLRGIMSNVYDNFTMVASAATADMYNRIKKSFSDMEAFAQRLRDAVEFRGLGGMFEELVPPELQGMVRQLIANFKTLGNALKPIGGIIGNIAKHLGYGLAQALNIVLPPITILLNILVRLIKYVSENVVIMRVLTTALFAAAAGWILFKLHALKAIALAAVTKIINGLTIAVLGLWKALVAHPIAFIMAAIAAAIIGVAIASKSADNSIANFFKRITQFGKVDPDKILLPSQEERANDLDKFNNKLEDTATQMEEVEKATTKARRALLSFDEVYSINELDSGGLPDNLDDIINIPDIGLDTDAWIPEIPDFGEFAGDYVDGLIEALKGELGVRLAQAGIGALIGGLLGGILGGVPGAKIGAAAGALVGWFWDEIAEAFELTDTEKYTVPIATSIGAIIGGLVGGIPGALIGGVLGYIAGVFAAWFWDEFAEELGKGPDNLEDMGYGALVGALIGGLLGGMLGGVAGAKLGIGVGALVGAIIGMFKDEIQEFFTTDEGIGVGIGGAIGAAIGAIALGPGGAAIGYAVGALVGWLIMKFKDELTEIFTSGGGLGTTIGAGLGAIIGGLAGGPVGALIGAAIGGVVGWIIGQFNEGIGEGVLDLWTGFKEFFGDVGDWLENFEVNWIKWSATVYEKIEGYKEKWNGFWSSVNSKLEAFEVSWIKWSASVYEKVETFREKWDGFWGAIAGWFEDFEVKWIKFWAGAYEKLETFKEKWDGFWGAIAGWFEAFEVSWILFWAGAYAKIEGWKIKWDLFWAGVSNLLTTFKINWILFWASGYNRLTEWREKWDSFWGAIASWFEDFETNWILFWAGGYEKLQEWQDKWKESWDYIGERFGAFKEAWDNFWRGVGETIYDLLFGKIGGWLTESIDKLREFFGNTKITVTQDIVTTQPRSSPTTRFGHATGGIFDREHVARFSEGNKREAIIPLEEDSAMQPFVDAVANGLLQTLQPAMATGGAASDHKQILYVGNLIADERGLRELHRKMQVIDVQEKGRLS